MLAFFLLSCSFAAEQPIPRASPRDEPAIPRAVNKPPDRYGEAYRRSVASGRPVLVYVGCKPALPSCEAWDVVAVASLDGCKAGTLLIGLPAPGGLWRIDAPAWSSKPEVQRLIAGFKNQKK